MSFARWSTPSGEPIPLEEPVSDQRPRRQPRSIITLPDPEVRSRRPARYPGTGEQWRVSVHTSSEGFGELVVTACGPGHAEMEAESRLRERLGESTSVTVLEVERLGD